MFDTARLVALGDSAPGARAVRPVVAEALAHPPGPGLLAALTALGPLDLSAREATEVCLAWTRMIGHCTAGRLDAVAQLDRVVPRGRASGASLRPAANELAAALGLPGREASRLVGLSRRAQDLLAVADALAEGDVDPAHLRAVASVARDVPVPAHVRALEDLALQRGRATSAAALRMELEAEAERRMPGWAARRAAEGREDRDVDLRPSPVPGCRRITADLPLVAATAVWMAVNGAARAARSGGDGRSLPQLRADVLTAALTGGLPSGSAGPASTGGTVVEPVAVPGPERLAQLAEVHVVVSADALRGGSDLPAHVPGVGPVDLEHARSLAADARWRRLLADPATGTLLQHGTTVYRPPAALRRHTVARDGTCVAPTCTTPARLSQIDHTIPFGARTPPPAGTTAEGSTAERSAAEGSRGGTDAANTEPLCDRDHEAKTHLGWQLEQPSPGEFVWTSPTGRTYQVPARPLLPGWQADRTSRGDGPHRPDRTSAPDDPQPADAARLSRSAPQTPPPSPAPAPAPGAGGP